MPVVRFREQRGSLEESLATTISLDSREALIAEVRRVMAPLPVNAKDVEIRYYCYDPRTKWYTYLVWVREAGVAGFTDGLL